MFLSALLPVKVPFCREQMPPVDAVNLRTAREVIRCALRAMARRVFDGFAMAINPDNYVQIS